jgi:hypothetical protein
MQSPYFYQTAQENMEQNKDALVRRKDEIQKRHLLKGLEDTSMTGYGEKRISVISPSIAEANCPYTFTARSFRNADKKLFLIVKMNVDQNSPSYCKEWELEKSTLAQLNYLLQKHLTDYKVSRRVDEIIQNS